MKINIIYKTDFHSGAESKKILKDSVISITEIISNEEKIKFGSLNIIFCGDEFIRKFNKEYLKHDYETDIITFQDTDNAGLTEGELIISIETIKENSKRFKVSYDNELMRVIIHGLMHLSGYNDKSGDEKKIIRKKENYYLKYIKQNAGKNN